MAGDYKLSYGKLKYRYWYMKATNDCYNLIMKYEGCAFKAYRCSANIWTIGYGHTSGVREGDKITPEEARQYLLRDVNLYEAYVNENIVKKLDYELTQGQFDALVSFAFNLGSIKSGFRACLMMGDFAGAVEKMLLYTKSDGKYMLGLHRRRMAEALLFTGMIVNEADKEYIRAKIDHYELNCKGVELLKWYKKELQ